MTMKHATECIDENISRRRCRADLVLTFLGACFLSVGCCRPDEPSRLLQYVRVHRPNGIMENESGVVYVLQLQGMPLGDRDMEGLSRLCHLKSLTLDRTGITDQGLQEVGKAVSLESLELNHTQITDAGIKHLQGLRNLRVLSLNGTSVTDGAVDSILALRALSRLNVLDTGVTKEGISRLRASLPHLDAAVGKRSVHVPEDGIPVIRYMALDRHDGIRRSSSGEIVALALHFTNVCDSDFIGIEKLTHLGELKLDSTVVTDHALKHIGKVRSLELLDLDWTGVTNRGLWHLTGLRNLKGLSLSPHYSPNR